MTEYDALQYQDGTRYISSWREFFVKNQDILFQQVAVVAQGGTIDGVATEDGLSPIFHPVNIPFTRNLNASQIGQAFLRERKHADTLGNLYFWSSLHADIPWSDIKMLEATRISSFDSGQEKEEHFVASLWYDYRLLERFNAIMHTKGTDSLVDQATLHAVLLIGLLKDKKKKIIFLGSSQPGTEVDSLAIPNVTSGLYALLEEALPAGVYISSSLRLKNGTVRTEILPALGSVKLHADGVFHAPNSGPVITFSGNAVYLHPLKEDLIKRSELTALLPDLSQIYLQNEEGLIRLQNALQTVSIETVKNPARVLKNSYKDGMRVFVIQARGSGNAPLEWRETIEEIVGMGDTTVMVITLADSGDVDLNKYAAGLDIPGVISGRALREDAAWILAGIIHDLKINGQLRMEPQKLINLYCYLSGMINLKREELISLSHDTDADGPASHLIYSASY